MTKRAKKLLFTSLLALAFMMRVNPAYADDPGCFEPANDYRSEVGTCNVPWTSLTAGTGFFCEAHDIFTRCFGAGWALVFVPEAAVTIIVNTVVHGAEQVGHAVGQALGWLNCHWNPFGSCHSDDNDNSGYTVVFWGGGGGGGSPSCTGEAEEDQATMINAPAC